MLAEGGKNGEIQGDIAKSDEKDLVGMESFLSLPPAQRKSGSSL